MHKIMKAKHYIYVLFVAMLALATMSCEDRLNIEKHGSMGGPRIIIRRMRKPMLP